MTQTIEAVLLPDGTIKLAEPLHTTTPRRILVTVPDEVVVGHRPDSLHAVLVRAGLAHPRTPTILDQPLSTAELEALVARVRPGPSLSDMVIEEREERF